MWRVLIALPLLASLAACDSLSTANQYAGINHVRVDYSETGEPESVVVYAGKEAEELDITLDHPSGLKATYKARDLKAFDGQAARAEVEKAQLEVLGKVVPDLTDAIINAIIPLL